MSNQFFSKIWAIIIILILIAGGVFAWQYFGLLKKETKAPEKKL